MSLAGKLHRRVQKVVGGAVGESLMGQNTEDLSGKDEFESYFRFGEKSLWVGCRKENNLIGCLLYSD